MTRLLFSIPIHEKPDVVLGQIDNIFFFNPNSSIVLHISKEFYYKYDDSELKIIPNVFINTVHNSIKWGDIINSHISNFIYAIEKIDFDYFVMHSSNDMYIRSGALEYIKQFDAGFQQHRIIEGLSHWNFSQNMFDDQTMKQYINKYSINTVNISQVEGSFYNKYLLHEIVDTIKDTFNSCYIYSFPREEVLFSLSAQIIQKKINRGYPVVWSEVNRHDRIIWTIRNKIIGKQNKRLFNKLERVLFKLRPWRLKINDVKKIINGDRKFLIKNNVLYDIEQYEINDIENIFAVKRVPRNHSSNLRKYISKILLFT